jgi:hypothetical protein
MDVHREFAQLAVVEDGLVRDEGRIAVTPEALREWAASLNPDDQVALEATGNSDAIANLLAPLVGRVVVSNPSKTRAIAEAKVKTDKVDARILAQLLAADFLPPVWLPDERTRSLPRQVTRRAHIVRARTRLKNQVHAILARNLCPTPPVSDLFGKTGRHWLMRQHLPADESATVRRQPRTQRQRPPTQVRRCVGHGGHGHPGDPRYPTVRDGVRRACASPRRQPLRDGAGWCGRPGHRRGRTTLCGGHDRRAGWWAGSRRRC